MNRRPLAWLVAVPLMTAGSLTAHALAYRIVEPDSSLRLDLLARTGHGYLASAPLLLGAALAVALAGLAAHAVGARRGRPPAQPAAWPLALLPPLGFMFQEHLERLVASGDMPLAAVTEPTFLVGLLLQLPFALVALVAARALGRAAEALGRAPKTPQRPGLRPGVVPRPVVALLPNAPRLAAAHSGRAPPV
jgi:hypothetical protein